MNVDISYTQLVVTIVIGSGTGTALVQLLLSHWLKEKYFKFKLSISDKRGVAEEILKLIDSDNYTKWNNINDDVYHQEYSISDKLIVLGFKKESELLDKFASRNRHEAELFKKIFDGDAANHHEIDKDFLDTLAEIDSIRLQILEIVKKLKK